MNTQEIRKAYIKFFQDRNYKFAQRAPIVLNDDPTTLFTGSGMQPIIPYLLGQEHPLGDKLVNSQVSFRAQDIEEVGDNRHTTFFEMLGNWSLGTCDKKQQIQDMYEFLSEVVGLDMNNFYVTCFIGAPEYGIERDTVSAEAWAELLEKDGHTTGVADIGSEEDGYNRGMKDDERIFYYDGDKNWWSRNGSLNSTPVGDPCGPDTEMFYDFGTPHDTSYGEHCHPNCDCGRFMEIGNNVFMGYRKIDAKTFEPLEKPNVDHGSGLERIAAAKLNKADVYEISLLKPIVTKMEELSGKKYEDNVHPMRVIADHGRAAFFMAVDGCQPSNKQQGYVMRRLLRRMMRYAHELGVESAFFDELVPILIGLYEVDFPEVSGKKDDVLKIMQKEEKTFRQTLKKGLKHFEKMMSENSEKAGEIFFTLYDTYGFPLELSVEESEKHNYKLPESWQADYDKKLNEQRERSKTATKGTFKGGLEGDSDIHLKYHTATHLMYKALKMVLGDHVVQRGSNITSDRLRFDFSHPEKVVKEQLKQVEDIVNEQIEKNLKVSYKEYPTDQAFEMGAIGAFGDKYGDKVKVYQMGEDDDRFSFEICGGPHVEQTAKLSEDGKKFVITKEESSSSGVRRIKAVLK